MPGLTLKQLMQKQAKEAVVKARQLTIKNFRFALTRQGHPGVQAVVKSETNKAKTYVCQIVAVETPKIPTDQSKLNKNWVQVSCDCPKFKFGCEYALAVHGAAKIIHSDGVPAVKTNPHNQPHLCVEENQLVLTDMGKKKIKDVKDGDWVKTLQGWQPVFTAVCTGYEVPVYRVCALTSGKKKRRFELVCTNNHPLLCLAGWSPSRGNLHWRAVAQLKSGDKVAVYQPRAYTWFKKLLKAVQYRLGVGLPAMFEWATITGIQPAGRATVYNLTVKNQPNFVAEGFAVHNCKHLLALASLIQTKPV